MNRAVVVALFLFSFFGIARAGAAQTPAQRGAQLFIDQKCSLCHSVAGKGNAKGPIEEGVAKLSTDEIRQWLVDPQAMRDKTDATRKPIMKSYASLPKDDVDGLVAYLLSLKKP